MAARVKRNSKSLKYLQSSRSCFGSNFGADLSPREGIVVGAFIVAGGVVGIGSVIGGVTVVGGISLDGSREGCVEAVSEEGASEVSIVEGDAVNDDSGCEFGAIATVAR